MRALVDLSSVPVARSVEGASLLKQLLRDGAVYGSGRLVVAVFGLLLTPFLTRFLTQAEYGLLDLLILTSAVLQIVITLEVAQGFARIYAEVTDPEERIRLSSTLLWFAIACAGVALLSAFIAAPAASRAFFESPRYATVIRLAVLLCAVQCVLQVFQAQLRYDRKPVPFACSSAVQAVVLLLSGFVLVGALKLQVVGALLAYVAAAGAGAAMAYVFARDQFRLVFDRVLLARMLRFSAPLVVSSLGVFAMVSVDRVAIASLLTLDDVAVYALSWRVASVVALVGTACQLALAPIVYREYRTPGSAMELERVARWFIGVAGAGVLVLTSVAGPAVRILAPPGYGQAVATIPFLCLAVLVANMPAFAPGLWIGNRSGVIAVLNLAGALFNLALNFLLIPIVGVPGAAIASLVSGLGVFMVYVHLGARYYPVPFLWSRILPAVAILIGSITVAVLGLPGGGRFAHRNWNSDLVTMPLLWIAAGLMLCVCLTTKDSVALRSLLWRRSHAR